MAAPKKYSPGLARMIVDHIEDGMTIAEICRKYPDMICLTMKPETAERQVHRWRRLYPDFNKAVNLGYQTLMIKQIDEVNDLSKELLELDSKIRELQSNLTGENAYDILEQVKIEAIRMRERRDNIRVRIDVIKFNLAKLAPKMVPELRDQVALVAPPTIQIIRYTEPEIKTIESK